ncbi:hypothetical protein BH09GEM1_BH09GEM1_05680 [soil metagenome]
MTRKRLRYSDLAASAPVPKPEPEPEPKPEPRIEPEPKPEPKPEPRIEPKPKPQSHVMEPPARPRRDSTPVELARTRTAERAAARAEEDAESELARPARAYSIEEPEPAPYRTLRERARARSGMAELLMFRIGSERFAVELILVDEVIDLPVVHHVPEMPPAMLGVVTVRGALTPVYSPHQALGLPLALREAVLIFRRGGFRVGILIDDVDDAISLDLGELRETPGGDEVESVLLGVVRVTDALVGIVDVDALIASCQSAEILELA